MPKKLYFLTTEIVPFANVTSLAMFSTRVPLALQEKGHDIRTIIPKYGYVSERKYILREVIRLREIPFEFNGSNRMASAKSAFIPKTRVQVYFLEDSSWFQPLSNLVYKSKNGRILADNGERYCFFSKAVLSTLPHLFGHLIYSYVMDGRVLWFQGCIKHFEGINDFYKKIKTVMVVHDLNEHSDITRKDLELAEVPVDKSLKGNTLNAFEVGAFHADAIVVIDKPSDTISEKLLKKPGIAANKKKVSVIKVSDDESPDFQQIADEMDQIFKKLSD